MVKKKWHFRVNARHFSSFLEEQKNLFCFSQACFGLKSKSFEQPSGQNNLAAAKKFFRFSLWLICRCISPGNIPYLILKVWCFWRRQPVRFGGHFPDCCVHVWPRGQPQVCPVNCLWIWLKTHTVNPPGTFQPAGQTHLQIQHHCHVGPDRGLIHQDLLNHSQFGVQGNSHPPFFDWMSHYYYLLNLGYVMVMVMAENLRTLRLKIKNVVTYIKLGCKKALTFESKTNLWSWDSSGNHTLWFWPIGLFRCQIWPILGHTNWEWKSW